MNGGPTLRESLIAQLSHALKNDRQIPAEAVEVMVDDLLRLVRAEVEDWLGKELWAFPTQPPPKDPHSDLLRGLGQVAAAAAKWREEDVSEACRVIAAAFPTCLPDYRGEGGQ